jgi:predicted NodU family carbamoyl transferase
MGANEKLVSGELLTAMHAKTNAGWCNNNQQIIIAASVQAFLSDVVVTIHKNINEEINHV